MKKISKVISMTLLILPLFSESKTLNQDFDDKIRLCKKIGGELILESRNCKGYRPAEDLEENAECLIRISN